MPRTPVSTKLDSKQVDKVQKLINLANNNPNEHEANLAARNACKMLDGYLFPTTATATPPPPPNKPYQSPGPPYRNPFDDIFRGGFRPSQAQRDFHARGEWGGFYDPVNPSGKRSTTPGREPPGSNREAKQGETETKSEPHQDFGRGGQDPFADFKKAYDEVYADDYWDDYYEEFLNQKKANAEGKQRPNPLGKDFNFTTLSQGEVEVFIRHADWERNIDKRIIKCAKCQKPVKTGYSGEAWVFVCMTCELKVAAKRR